MNCVNKSSKEFKSLASRNNVSDNALELIVHKYWREKGNESYFPSDSYIQAQLGAIPYEETGKSVKKLWNKKYSSPQSYDTFEKLQSAIVEAQRYFPNEAIVHYQNADGKFVLAIRQPVRSFYKALDEAEAKGSFEAPIIPLEVEEGKEYTLDTAQNLFEKFNKDRTSKPLADKVFKIAKDLGIKIYFNNVLSDGNVGAYHDNNSITFYKAYFERGTDNDKKAEVILHEVIHALTTYALSDDVTDKPKALQDFKNDMEQLFKELQYNPMLKGEYGVNNIRDFVAELANPIFRQKIQAIDNNRKQSFWQRIVDAFKKLLGIHFSSPYYTRMMNTLDRALNAFDVKTYMEYNGITESLRNRQLNQKSDVNNENNKTEEQYGKAEWQRGLLAGGQILSEALKRGIGTDSQRYGENEGKTTESSNVREGVHEESARQQQSLINWAQKNNYLIVEPNDYFNEILGDNSLHGTESKVWEDSINHRVIKSISLSHYPTPKALLERILVHNSAFPSTTIKLEGIGTSGNGMSLIVSQPLIEDSDVIPTYEEIETYMTKTLGFQHTKGKGANAEYTKDGYLVSDIRPENIIKQSNGELAIIDCFAMIQKQIDKISNIDYDTLSTGDLKNELHNYVNTKLAGKVKSTDALNSFIDSLSKEELGNIYDEVLHNYDDTQLIVNKLRQLAREKGLPNKQNKYFTFKDGKSVKAPFVHNDQQVDALNKINDFLHSDKDVMTLSGYAGTGKTSIMEMIAEKAKQDGIGIVFTATTNKATQVLQSKVGYLGFPVMTANKAFGIALEPGDKAVYDADDLKTRLVDNKIDGYNAAIIDEASMINQENFDILTNIAKETGLKIIFVGDIAQLPPVEKNRDSTKLSPVFTNSQGDVITLTKVERTDDNAILKEATNLRNGGNLSGVSSFNKEGKGVAYIKPGSEERDKIIKAFAPKMTEDPDYFRILTYSNKSVAQYNEITRRLLGYADNTPRVGETILGYTNYDYDRYTQKNNFVNSGSYKVVAVAKPVVQTVTVYGVTVSITAVPVTIKGIDGISHTYNMVDIKGNKANKKAVVPIAKALETLWAQWKRGIDRKAILQKIHEVESYLFVNGDIFDDKGNKLLNKRYDFGYAMTIHKSQGSTFKNVLLDDVNVAMYNKYLDKEALKKAATHVHTDTSNVDLSKSTVTSEHSNVDNAQIQSSMSINGLFDDAPVTAPSTTQSISQEQSTANNDIDNMVDIRRQLEYVGVSRATDTVTIISNNVKKEGSPLHPETTPSEITQSPTAPTKLTVPTSKDAVPASYEGMITPDANTIFVFGSNPEGRHGAGAAKIARDRFGAIYGQGEGLQGNSYALPTKDLRVKKNNSYKSISPEQITENIKKMYEVARQHSDKQFKVVYTNGLNQATLNGYTGAEMIKMFKNAGPVPSNVVFNKNWTDHWNEVKTSKPIASIPSIDSAKEDKSTINPVQQVLSDKSTNMQTILSLPNFEHFVYDRAADKLKGIKVDAPWKEQYLKDLDSQFRRMEDEDEEKYHMSDADKQYNQTLIDKMKVILNAKDKDDYLNDKQRDYKEKLQSALSDYDKLNQQYANLLNGMTDKDGAKWCDSPFTVSEIRHVAELVMDSISDTITDIQTQDGLAEKLFPNVKTEEGFDFKKVSRENIIGTIGIENLLANAKKTFDVEHNNWFEDRVSSF